MQDRYAPHPQSEISTDQAGLEQNARKAIEEAGFRVSSINFIPEGRQHNVFDVILSDWLEIVARFEKRKGGTRKDSQFKSPLTLERERNLMELVREQGLPAPIVYGQYETEEGKFILVEKMPGVHWSEYISNNNYSQEAYLRSLRFLGRDLALAHGVKFTSFGNVMAKDSVEPSGIADFAKRVNLITELRLESAFNSEAPGQDDLNRAVNYLTDQSAQLEQMLKDTNQQPGLILADLHPMNFFVDESGKPSGFFDLEACQAGHPALEIYNLRAHILNYFEGLSQEAEESFLAGYHENGGVYDPQNPVNQKLEHVLSVGHLLAVTTAYHGASDGLRDTWSDQFKRILNDSMQTGHVDFQAISTVFRTKTQQPQFPALP